MESQLLLSSEFWFVANLLLILSNNFRRPLGVVCFDLLLVGRSDRVILGRDLLFPSSTECCTREGSGHPFHIWADRPFPYCFSPSDGNRYFVRADIPRNGTFPFFALISSTVVPLVSTTSRPLVLRRRSVERINESRTGY